MAKVVVITGASTGIGEALAQAYFQKGYHVGLIARRENLLQQISQRLSSVGDRVAYHPADVTSITEMQAAVDYLTKSLGPIDCLVANAGIGDSLPLKKFDALQAKQIIDVNVTGVVNSISAVLPQMISQGKGHLVAVSSLAAYINPPHSYVYCASKAAVNTIMKGLWMESKDVGIDVSIVMPGFIRTALTDKNNHKMPFLMETDRAAEIIIRGIEAKKLEIRFPAIMWWAIRLISSMPIFLQKIFFT